MNPSCPEFDPCASNNNSIDNEISRQSEIAMDQQTKHRFDKSLAALYRAASLSKHSYGSSDSRTLKLNEEIASVWFRKGNYSQAEETLNYVLQQRLHCYSSYNVDTLNTMHQMGLIIKRQYRLMEAFSMFQDAYSGFVALLGMSHYATAQAAYSLAIINILLGQKSNAYGYFHVASGTFKNVLGKYHILTLAALEWEARCYLAEQRTGESIDLSTSKSEWQNRKNCELCGERFRFFRNHRHHCRVCSRTVCNSCSTHTTLVIEFHNRNTVRMCDKCFDQGF